MCTHASVYERVKKMGAEGYPMLLNVSVAVRMLLDGATPMI